MAQQENKSGLDKSFVNYKDEILISSLSKLQCFETVKNMNGKIDMAMLLSTMRDLHDELEEAERKLTKAEQTLAYQGLYLRVESKEMEISTKDELDNDASDASENGFENLFVNYKNKKLVSSLSEHKCFDSVKDGGNEKLNVVQLLTTFNDMCNDLKRKQNILKQIRNKIELHRSAKKASQNYK